MLLNSYSEKSRSLINMKYYAVFTDIHRHQENMLPFLEKNY